MALNSPEGQDLLERWRTETDMDVRDEILEELFEAGIFPKNEQEEWEEEGGLYPGIDDPDFVPKMMRKKEYQESKQPSVKESLEEGKDRCRSTEDFELSPVQRFVSRFINPRTPFRSALIYHGVGVGKTCTAVTVCESFLEVNPAQKIFVVAPPNILDGFKRTIFDKEALTIPDDPNLDTSHRGCTGNTYLSLTGSFKEKNRVTIERRVATMMNSRYNFFGYASFYNYINKKLGFLQTLKGKLSDQDIESKRREVIRREFSDKVFIIDEAHNLRDNPFESSSESADDASVDDTNESKAGKRLTPFLKDVLSIAENVTLVLMTATPMYNSYIEILFLLNLLLLNDKRATLSVEDVFDIKTEKFKPGGRELLGKIASCYISFMRGENPLTFPMRLEPLGIQRVTKWPRFSPKGDQITLSEQQNCIRLPCMMAKFDGMTELKYKAYCKKVINTEGGLGFQNRDQLVQAGNWIFPDETGTLEISERKGQDGFDNTFEKERTGSTTQFRSTLESGAKWLVQDNLIKASGKCKLLLDRLNNCKGVGFVYSRFVTAGGLMIALALEANGYLPWGKDTGLLAEGNQHPKGYQCALCPKHQKEHLSEDHPFKQARYILLTGSEELSPNNNAAIVASRNPKNYDGSIIKVILGSQIAGEGLDLKYVREVFVFDSWYHLNKLEQIIGRGIRNCSHSSLPEEKRNCTVTLLVNSYGSEPNTESIDMFAYRAALNKARVVGMVTRVLKEFALDCSLNKEAILVSGLDPLPKLLDSQGMERRGVNRNDTPLTPMCDWLETCDYECHSGTGEVLDTEISIEDQDSSTYDEYTARYQIIKLKNYLKDLVQKGQAFVSFENIVNHFTSIPRHILSILMMELTEQKEFKIGEGRVIYKNGYFLYQPDLIEDTRIPISIRLAHMPIRRDKYEPVKEEVPEKVKEEEGEKGDSEDLWIEVQKYSDQIKTGRASRKEIPNILLEKIDELPESVGVESTQREKVDMIKWLYDMLYDNIQLRTLFSDVILEYFWDEFLTTGTRRMLLTTKLDEQIRKVASESFWLLDGETYIRLLNKEKYSIEYFKVVGSKVEPLSEAISRGILEKEEGEDPLRKEKITDKNTNETYGFIAKSLKLNTFIFKRGKPPKLNKKGEYKLGKGGVCSSTTDFERKLLESYGDILKRDGKNQMGLVPESIAKIKNSVRVCALNDLIFRMMDKLRVNRKRWFYRPLESMVKGHPLS